MADKKISQLTSATLPLAGTELVPVVQSGVTSQVSAANLGAAAAYTPAGTGAVVGTVIKRLDRTACDLESSGSADQNSYSSLPSAAVVAVNLTRTALDKHAFEDWSTLNITSGSSLGYASFDAKPTLTNSVNSLHLVGYQSRATFAGSAPLTQYWHGYDTAMVHNGTGLVTEASGVYVNDITGTGKANITNFYGVYIASLTAGATLTGRWGIYSDAGNQHMFGGFTGSIFTGTVLAAGLNYNNDVVNKSISYGFGSSGQANFGTHNFYNGKNSIVASITSTGMNIVGNFGVSGVMQLGSYTVAALPSAGASQLAYATNGRKIGEGAGSGTGVPVYYSNGAWRRFSDDSVVVA